MYSPKFFTMKWVIAAVFEKKKNTNNNNNNYNNDKQTYLNRAIKRFIIKMLENNK